MAKITVVQRDGAEKVVEGQNGHSVMQVIRDEGFEDLLALCGGCCSCATCHVYIELPAGTTLPQMSRDEDDLLDSSSHRQQNSRLSCQIALTPGLEGLRVTIAPED